LVSEVWQAYNKPLKMNVFPNAANTRSLDIAHWVTQVNRGS